MATTNRRHVLGRGSMSWDQTWLLLDATVVFGHDAVQRLSMRRGPSASCS
jgi:hypothetical protein